MKKGAKSSWSRPSRCSAPADTVHGLVRHRAILKQRGHAGFETPPTLDAYHKLPTCVPCGRHDAAQCAIPEVQGRANKDQTLQSCKITVNPSTAAHPPRPCMMLDYCLALCRHS